MSTSYTQSGPKRARVKDTKVTDSVDYFQGIDKIEYNNMASINNSHHYRYYNGSERLNGRSMEEWLKYSVSLTEFRSNGSDKSGRPTYQRPWDDHTNNLENLKRSIKACFDFCVKLGVRYWTAFDSDLVPWTENYEENRSNWEEIAEFIGENVARTHVRPLWIAPDLHSHTRYASGAFTNPDSSTYIHAAAQIKKCLEISQRLNCECFLLWPCRDGYDAIFKSDIAREIKLFSKLLKITADYKERLNYRCQMLIMPYYGIDYCGASYYRGNCNDYRGNWRENEMINRYMWDVTSCLFLLKNYNLDRHYKVCVPPGHDMFMANAYNMLGGVALNDGRERYGSELLALMMKSIVDQGACLPSGINLKLTPRRDSYDLKDLVTTYVKCIDAAAKGLRTACNVISEQIFAKHIQQRYSSFLSGNGPRLMNGEMSLDDCDECCKKSQHNEPLTSGRSEHLEILFQKYLDNCDQI